MEARLDGSLLLRLELRNPDRGHVCSYGRGHLVGAKSELLRIGQRPIEVDLRIFQYLRIDLLVRNQTLRSVGRRWKHVRELLGRGGLRFRRKRSSVKPLSCVQWTGRQPLV